MQDMMLYGAGGLGVGISIIHGYLGETKVVRTARLPSPQGKRILQALMFLSAVYWFAAGVLLLLAPTLISGSAKPFVIYGAAFLYLSGSIGNLWATRGRHFGWVLLAIAALLALAGA